MIVGIAKISTLTIHSSKPFSRDESIYINALSYLFDCFNEMETENSFSMYIDKNTFLLANKKSNRDINPLVFVNQKGEILYNIDICVFNKAINEFQTYINYYNKKEIPYEQKVQKAIKDYKNDKLDFYSKSPIIYDSLIEKAENILNQNIEI